MDIFTSWGVPRVHPTEDCTGTLGRLKLVRDQPAIALRLRLCTAWMYAAPTKAHLLCALTMNKSALADSQG